MKARLVDYLACPDCEAELYVHAAARDGDEVIEGHLECTRCARCYGVRGGIPRLVPDDLPPDMQKTARAFGWEWTTYVEMHPEYEGQFLDWIHPLRPEFFREKVVLDAGCGIGRHAYHAARYGAREVIGIDLSEAVETAYRNFGRLPNAHVVQADVYRPPFRRGPAGGPFDFVYSIGVLHHLPDPRAGFESLLRYVRPGGSIFAWVYGQENNGVVHHFIDPLRRNLTTRLPHGIVKAISWPLAVVLQGLAKGIYRPLRPTALFEHLPSGAYLCSLSEFSFRQNYSIVFDHLVAPTAFYLPRDEFLSWFLEAGLEEIDLSWRNQNSWRGRGRVPVRQPEPMATEPP